MVAAVMLANGRPDMVRRAVKSFRAQTYERKWLYILDSGSPSLTDSMRFGGGISYSKILPSNYSIGHLRNTANYNSNISDFGGIAPDDSGQIICHWDSDDWSHPSRISEQVAMLQSSGAECVGYDEMLFWRDPTPADRGIFGRVARRAGMPESLPDWDEAWIYREGGHHGIKNYAIGTSMCYWRETWQKFPFPDYSPGCDDWRWATGDTNTGVRAVNIKSCSSFAYLDDSQELKSSPRMIASIHGGNTCAKIDSTSPDGMKVWSRAPQWDAYCREAMKL